MNGHDQVWPLLAARPEELEPLQARLVETHVAACEVCAGEAAGYSRLTEVLQAMVDVYAEPPGGLLEDLLIAVARRRPGARELVAEHGPRALVAAGSAGALVATVVVARALHRRRGVLTPAAATPARQPARSVLAGLRTAWPARIAAVPLTPDRAKLQLARAR